MYDRGSLPTERICTTRYALLSLCIALPCIFTISFAVFLALYSLLRYIDQRLDAYLHGYSSASASLSTVWLIRVSVLTSSRVTVAGSYVASLMRLLHTPVCFDTGSGVDSGSAK